MVSGRRFTSGTAVSMRPLPPVSSKAKDYTDRPEEVMDELDELRTRGIAKVLNKHFTTTTRQLAIEKAEADSALADLERRRAQTKAFVPSKGGELNPYDKLYVQLKQKRSECRRKEKETMMLYQRYVMKYGKSAKAAPLVSTTPSSSTSEEPQEGDKVDQLRNSNSVEVMGEQSGKSALGTLDENSEITFSKFYEKQREEQEKQRLEKQDNEKNTQHFMSALTKFMTVSEDEEDKPEMNNVPGLVPSKDSPSPIASNGKVDPFMSAISKFTSQTTEDDATENNQSATLVDQDEDIQSNPETATQNAIEHTDSGIGAVVTPEIKRTPSKDPPTAHVSDIGAEDDSMVSQHEDHHDKDVQSPPKILRNGQSVIAQEEAKNLHASPDPVQEEATNLPASPDPVQQAAAITLSPSSNNSTPKINKIVRVDVNDQAPYFMDGSDIDDRSIISELTSANSAVTRQLMDEVETEMEDFIKFEMDAIRKMLDSEEDSSTVDFSVKSENSSVMLADQSVHVAMKAEAMALEMQKILDDFAKEDASSVEDSKSLLNESVQSSEHKKESTDPKNVYPYKFEPAIHGEDWYVHFDENYEKEYYVEKNSNRTQWDYPQKTASLRTEEENISSDDFLSDMHSVASSRRSLSRRSSRRALYRKQRKKRRARRLAMSFLALLGVLVTVFYWRLHHPDESIAGALAAVAVSLKNLSLEDAMKGVVDHFEYSFTNRQEREELIRQQQDALSKIETERKARDLADQKAKEEADQILEEAMEMSAQDEAAKKLEEEQECDQQQVAREFQKNSDRNWGCNIPFAYIVPHCWRLAKSSPIFGLKNENDLTFLQ